MVKSGNRNVSGGPTLPISSEHVVFVGDEDGEVWWFDRRQARHAASYRDNSHIENLYLLSNGIWVLAFVFTDGFREPFANTLETDDVRVWFLGHGIVPSQEIAQSIDFSRRNLCQQPLPPDPQITSNCDLTKAVAMPEQGEGIGGVGSAPTKTRKTKRGRRRLSREETQRRMGILSAWEQARNAGTRMKTFCREHRPSLSVKELDRFVAWKAMRDRRKAGS